MNGRMVSAELLRVRKSRALVVWMVIMTVGAVVAVFLIAEGFHLNNAHQNGPPGGATNLVNGVRVISFRGAVAAAILGCTVGASDLSSGVFRDLVVTGKARVALFGARVPGISQLGVTREAIRTSATTRVSPFSGPRRPGGDAATALHVSLPAAIVVLLAWILIPLAAGGWRTVTRDAGDRDRLIEATTGTTGSGRPTPAGRA